MPTTLKRILIYIFLPLLCVLCINYLTHNKISVLRYFLAAAPILAVLVSMVLFRVSGQYAGPIGLLTCMLVAWQAFGLNPSVFWISQGKGLLLTMFVLAVFLPALLLYNVINQANGIRSIADALKYLISERGILLLILAWAFSGMLEGLAGFGVPIAIISPMLVGLGISPILAVASVAVGHAWSVTFGDMGVIFQTLTSVVKVNPVDLAVFAAILLGFACLLCGLAAAHLFKEMKKWPIILALACIMAIVQYFLVVNHLTSLASFMAGFSGVVGGIFISRIYKTKNKPSSSPILTTSLKSALFSYGLLALIMILITIIAPIKNALGKYPWSVSFPEVKTMLGFITPAAIQMYRPLLHPGTFLLMIVVFSYFINKNIGLYRSMNFLKIVTITWKSSWPAIVGIFTMVELSSLMDHSGMTYLLANLLSELFKSMYPLISPFIGILGAFATGSNNNSNVLFGPLQESIATILRISPAIIVAAQTAGGSLGSMIAPAKIIVGCSTVDLKNQEGEVLRKTIPYGLIIGLIIGIVTLFLIKLF
jgi:lactate permease